MSESSERDVHLGDGRVLHAREEGDPHGRPIFVLHGTPGCRALYAKHVEDARRHGVRRIGHDRPGNGGSTARPGRRMVDAAADVGEIADDLGIDRFAVWGHSGGGAPTLAWAATLPTRVVAAASLASVAPWPMQGADCFAGMGEFNIADWKLMMADRPGWEANLQRQASEMIAATPEQLTEALSSLYSEVDRAALSPELAAFLRNGMREGLQPGIEGFRDDNLWDAAPWGFELSDIHVPLQLWHGRHDRFVTFSHGQWLVAHVPDAEAHLEPEGGHVTLLERGIPTVHRWLVSLS